jgi:hypothetical protein
MSFWTLTPRRILWDVVAIAEVIVSIVVHLSYALSIFGSAVWIDVMSILSASSSSNSTPPRHKPKKRDSSDDKLLVQVLHSPVVTTVLHEDQPDDDPDHHHSSQLGLEEVAEENKKQQQLGTIATTEEPNRAFLDGHQKAPIVLVHGIFGFGKGVKQTNRPSHEDPCCTFCSCSLVLLVLVLWVGSGLEEDETRIWTRRS